MEKSLTVLWDFDGTLFDTYPTILDNFFTILGRNENREEALKWFKDSSVAAYKHYGLERSMENLRKADELSQAVDPSQTPPYDGVYEALEMVERNVIVTNKDRESVERILSYYKLSHLFEDIICLGDGFERKPKPGSYEYMHRNYNVDLVVGDRELDFVPARELGILTCSFQNTEIEADYHLSDYRQFREVLEQVAKRLVKS